ncbi:hypothetical protein PENCOP_c005G06232 [Penicillium coprophilum]|uniref:O-methyltransferase domain-containing protein n=1 Tax=Penicillium coprophilum TaxID=36646 RepID=A0A1V6UQZ3_9EURO|nr:hypothetical protein PENCOP_c005G06232 [Penicillium coprophilum]
MDAKLSAISMEKIKEQMERPAGRPDFLEHFMQTINALREGDVCANAVAMIGAGGDTTATLLSETTFFLPQNPEFLTKSSLQPRQTFKLESEIDQAAADGNALLQSCVLETLRVYPRPQLVLLESCPRKAQQLQENLYLKGQTTVCIPQYVANHSADNFSSSDDFFPERWLEPSAFEHNKKNWHFLMSISFWQNYYEN